MITPAAVQAGRRRLPQRLGATSTSSTSRAKTAVQLTPASTTTARRRGRPTAADRVREQPDRGSRRERQQRHLRHRRREGGRAARADQTAGYDARPVSAPTARAIAYLTGGDPKDIWYAPTTLALVPGAGGAPRLLTPALDRNVARRASRPTASGLFLLEDGGNEHLAGCRWRAARSSASSPASARSRRSTSATAERSPSWRAAARIRRRSSPSRAGELAPLTRVNDAFLAGIRLGRCERFKARSADGTAIDAFLTLPPDAASGDRLRPSCASMAGRSRSTRPASSSSGRCSPPRATRSSPPTRAVRRATAGTSAAPSSPTGATRTTTT